MSQTEGRDQVKADRRVENSEVRDSGGSRRRVVSSRCNGVSDSFATRLLADLSDRDLQLRSCLRVT